MRSLRDRSSSMTLLPMSSGAEGTPSRAAVHHADCWFGSRLLDRFVLRSLGRLPSALERRTVERLKTGREGVHMPSAGGPLSRT